MTKCGSASNHLTSQRHRLSGSSSEPVTVTGYVFMAPASPIGASSAIRGSPDSSRKPLLEPVVGVPLVVERRHLHPTRRAVERDRLGEVAVRLEPERADAVLARQRLELCEQTAA